MSTKKELIESIRRYKALNCPSFSNMKLDELHKVAQALGVGPYLGQRKDAFSEVTFVKHQKSLKSIQKQREKDLKNLPNLINEQKNLEGEQLKISQQIMGQIPLDGKEQIEKLGPLEIQFLNKKIMKISAKLTKINDKIKSLMPAPPVQEPVKPKENKLLKRAKRLLRKVKKGVV